MPLPSSRGITLSHSSSIRPQEPLGYLRTADEPDVFVSCFEVGGELLYCASAEGDVIVRSRSVSVCQDVLSVSA